MDNKGLKKVPYREEEVRMKKRKQFFNKKEWKMLRLAFMHYALAFIMVTGTMLLYVFVATIIQNYWDTPTLCQQECTYPVNIDNGCKEGVDDGCYLRQLEIMNRCIVNCIWIKERAKIK